MIKLLGKAVVLTIALMLVGMVTAPQAEAVVRVQVKKVYYDIKGRTGIELAKSMIRRGPKAAGLQHAIASTKPDIDFGKPKGIQTARYCKIKDVDVKVTLTYTYPRWRGSKKASKQLQNAWHKLRRELIRHEETHGRIVIQTAQKIYREILRDRGTVSKKCNDYGKRVMRNLPRIIRTYERRQRAFDRRESWGISRVTRLQKQLLRVK